MFQCYMYIKKKKIIIKTKIPHLLKLDSTMETIRIKSTICNKDHRINNGGWRKKSNQMRFEGTGKLELIQI